MLPGSQLMRLPRPPPSCLRSLGRPLPNTSALGTKVGQLSGARAVWTEPRQGQRLGQGGHGMGSRGRQGQWWSPGPESAVLVNPSTQQSPELVWDRGCTAAFSAPCAPWAGAQVRDPCLAGCESQGAWRLPRPGQSRLLRGNVTVARNLSLTPHTCKPLTWHRGDTAARDLHSGRLLGWLLRSCSHGSTLLLATGTREKPL